MSASVGRPQSAGRQASGDLSSAHAAFDAVLGLGELGGASSTNTKTPSESSRNDSSFILSILPLLNFGDPTRVTHADWQRGTRSLGMHHLADDLVVWDQFTKLYGDGREHADATAASVSIELITSLIPVETSMLHLLRALVFAIDHVKDFAAKQTRKAEVTKDWKTSRMVLNKPIFSKRLKVVV